MLVVQFDLGFNFQKIVLMRNKKYPAYKAKLGLFSVVYLPDAGNYALLEVLNSMMNDPEYLKAHAAEIRLDKKRIENKMRKQLDLEYARNMLRIKDLSEENTFIKDKLTVAQNALRGILNFKKCDELQDEIKNNLKR